MNATEYLNTLIAKKDLTEKEASSLLEDIISGEISTVQAGAILTALRIKGESTEEITGLIKKMREKMVRIAIPDAVDIVGTGGGGADTFNVSTAAAFVVRGAGAKVAKHGNRAASSKCGSADVLEALGVKIDLTKERAQQVFDTVGIIFMLATLYHPAMKQVVAVRRELKIRTIFNILGPFTNPAGTSRQLTGVLDVQIAEKMANVARHLGYKHLLIVTSEDGIDELTTSAKSIGFEVRGTQVKKIVIDPAKLGFKQASREALAGGTAQENAEAIQSILEGEKGPRRDVVVLNAGAALYVAGVAKKIQDGIRLAKDSIGSGNAKKALSDLVMETNRI